MLIRFTVSAASRDGSYRRGDVVEWDDDDAARLIEAGHAEPAKPAPKSKSEPEPKAKRRTARKVETATAPGDAETADA